MKIGDAVRYQGILLMVYKIEGEIVYASNPTMQLAISVGHPDLEILP